MLGGGGSSKNHPPLHGRLTLIEALHRGALPSLVHHCTIQNLQQIIARVGNSPTGMANPARI